MGENEQAVFWIAVYHGSLPVLEKAAFDMQELMDVLPLHLREDAEVNDLRQVTAGVDRMRARLDYWQDLADRPAV